MNVALIPAAGSGTRFGGQIPKQFLEIAGAPVIIHTLRRFEACRDIDGIVVALQPGEIESFRAVIESCGFQTPIRLVAGGAERSESILNALEASRDWNPQLIAVHDAVRPFVTPQQISEVLDRARQTGAAILALPATDTIKEVEGGIIRRTIDRQRIYRAQTPQAFRYDILLRANERARHSGLPSGQVTDDSLLVENLGLPVAVVEGSARNIKITTREDIALAERLLEEEMNDEKYPDSPARTGHRIGFGNDIHKLVPGRKLILGGVEIPFEKGLLGHSDGDSLSHAITDALLGAAGQGDIGSLFSDTDPRWAGAESMVFLTHVCRMLADQGFVIANIDATILAERPRMMPHIPLMKEKLALTMGIEPSLINIKAKTNEGLDALGRGEAIGAQAIALITYRKRRENNEIKRK